MAKILLGCVRGAGSVRARGRDEDDRRAVSEMRDAHGRKDHVRFDIHVEDFVLRTARSTTETERVKATTSVAGRSSHVGEGAHP